MAHDNDFRESMKDTVKEIQKDLLTLPEVREILGLGYNTFNRYIRDGKITVVRITKRKRFIRKQDLDKFIEEHTGVYKQ